VNEQDEFYIGWQSRAPVQLSAHVRKTVVALLVLVLCLACILPWAQRTIGVAVFEWGTVKTFTGVLQTKPYPHLLIHRPARHGGESAYYLVAPFKFGLDLQAVAGLDGKPVTLKGTLIYRGEQTMIEARPDTIKPAPAQSGGFVRNETAAAIESQNSKFKNPQSPVTLVGEIVDSKCYLGVMNPGRLTPHRGCAVRCISGGIPPLLLVRRENGPPLYFLLVSRDGRPVNKQVLDMVAEPVEITGKLVKQGELSILRADPATYRRVGK